MQNCILKKFACKVTVKVESDSITQLKTRNHRCPTCNTRFIRKEHLKNHVATVHEGKKPFQCNICKTHFSRKTSLNFHVASIHEGTKPLNAIFVKESF